MEETSAAEMDKLSTTEILHEGDTAKATGKRYLIGLDGTESSKRGYQRMISVLKPGDFVILVAGK